MSQSGSSQVRLSAGATPLPSGDAAPGGPQPPPVRGSSVARPRVDVPADDRTVISDRSPDGTPANVSVNPRPHELVNLLAGDRLGHFELLEYVGGGGMGAVFRARDTMLDREVAIKVLSRGQGADDETRRRFQVEAQSAARLDHQNIARVYYVGEDQGLNFIVFEFISGENIRDLVERQGHLPLADAISYTLQIAEALAHSSQREVVHRDIKPSNIIITEEGRAKLVDMGLARLHVQAPGEDLTASGVTLGTFDYISPEQARDPRTADVRSDLYSLGCTLYYMLTGRPPFPHGTVLQKLLQHQGDDAPDPRQFNADVPEEVAVLLRKMMAKEPRRRFQDPGALIGELLLLADRLDLRPMTSGEFWLAPRQQGSAFWERHLPWLAPVAVLLLVVIGLAWLDSSSRGLNADALAIRHPDAASSSAQNPSRAEGKETKSAPASEPGGSKSPIVPPRITDKEASGTRTADAPSVEKPQPVVQPGDEPEPFRVGTERTFVESTDDRPFDAEGAGAAAQVAQPRQNDPSASLSEPRTSAGIVAGPPSEGELSVTVGNSPTADAKAIQPAADAARSPSPGSIVGSGRDAATRPATVDPSRQPTAPSESDTTVPSANRATNGAATSAAAVSEVATRTGGISIVATGGGESRQFTSLKAACAAAKNNDVIELKYSGRREEEPLELSNLKLTIRAGEGFQPVVVFRPSRLGAASLAHSMLTLIGGRLNLVKLGLELEIPRDATADSWSLVESQRAEEIRLERCTLTIRNATDNGESYHQNVAFLLIKAGPGTDAMMQMPDPAPVHPVELVLQNSVARGEAALVRASEAQALSLHWENGLLATTEPLLVAGGGPTSAGPAQRVQVNLNHLTAIVRGGLIRLSAIADAPHLLPTDIRCVNSLLVSRDAPLIEQVGPQRVLVQESHVLWTGDRNFCRGFASAWKVVDLNAPTVPRVLNWSGWQSRWGSGETLLDGVDPIFKQPFPPDRPLNRATKEDFVLADRVRGSTIRLEATDGREAGMEPAQLPASPPEAPLPQDRKPNPATALPSDQEP